jgi:hypothetical protein
MGTGLGVVGQCPRIRGLVSARLQQLRSHWVPQHGGYYSPWSAWTVVPRTVWAPNIWVTPHVVVPTAVPPVVHARFVEVTVAPVPTVGFRNIEPIRAPTVGYAVARYARPVPAGEEWRERSLAANVAAPRNNTVMGAGSPRDLTDRGQTGGNGDASLQRATPSRSRLADGTPPRSTSIDIHRLRCRRSTHRAPAEHRHAPSCLAAPIPPRHRMRTSEAPVFSARRLVPIPTRARWRLPVPDAPVPAVSHRACRKLNRLAHQHRGSRRPIARHRALSVAPILRAADRPRRRRRRRRLRRDLLALHRPPRRPRVLHRHRRRRTRRRQWHCSGYPRVRAAAVAVNSE